MLAAVQEASLRGQIAATERIIKIVRDVLDLMRRQRSLGQIAEALIAHLNRPDGSHVRITVEIEADSTEGFPDDLRRTVSENARTLKFESSEFES